MFGDINMIVLVGGVVRHELRYTNSGKAVLSFTLACQRSYKSGDEWKKDNQYFDVTFWGGEKIAERLDKGTKLYVQGRLENRSWEDKNGEKKYKTSIIAEKVLLLAKYLEHTENVSEPMDGGQDGALTDIDDLEI